MNLKEVLKLADELVFTKTGQHLNNLQEAVLRGTIQGETYQEMAKEFCCSEGHIRDVGSKLWQVLSETLGEDIHKSNCRATMERLQISIWSENFPRESVQIGSVNFCGSTLQTSDILNSQNICKSCKVTTTKAGYQDLSEMPDFGNVYDRTEEIETLKKWILEESCKLVSLEGISGIGKTTLATQLIREIKDEFDYVVWRGLEKYLTFAELEADLIDFLSQQPEIASSSKKLKSLSLIKYLQRHRCLVILDDVHNLFSSGKLAGEYKPENQNYATFFKQIEELSHNSCFLLIGWEQPRQVPQRKNRNNSIRNLKLAGLSHKDAVNIFRDQGILASDIRKQLIERYQGNPLWLKIIATFMEDLELSDSELFLDDTIVLPEDLKENLTQQLNRLSETEEEVITRLAKEDKPVNLAKLLDNNQITSSDLLNALQSLTRRCLIEKQEKFYILQPVLKYYVKSCI